MRTTILWSLLAVMTILMGGCGQIGQSPASLTSADTRDSWGSISTGVVGGANQWITVITITVTGPEIDGTITQDMTYNAANGSWDGQLQVPNGVNRLFKVVAKDASGAIQYSGQKLADVAPGASAANNVSIDLYSGDEKSRILVRVSFANPYLGLGKLPTCWGPHTIEGQDPNRNRPTDQQISDQGNIVTRLCSGTRIYSSDERMVAVNVRAGIPCTIGVNLGPNEANNQSEISAAASTVAKYPQVSAIYVGNEMSMSGLPDGADLIGYVNATRAKCPGAQIGTADTYDYWYNSGLGRPELAAACDVIAYHDHIYWAGLSVDNAMVAIADHYKKMKALYPGKRIVIAEVGFPTVGDTRSAVPGEMNQRLFIQVFVPWAILNGVEYFLFELFDEPWKTGEPGGVGPHWGLFYNTLVAKPEINKIWF